MIIWGDKQSTALVITQDSEYTDIIVICYKPVINCIAIDNDINNLVEKPNGKVKTESQDK